VDSRRLQDSVGLRNNINPKRTVREDLMDTDAGTPFVLLKADKVINDAMVTEELSKLWEQFRESAVLQEKVLKLGVDKNDLEQLVAEPASPFTAGRPEGQIGIAESILISVAAGLAKDAIVAIWKVYIWPRLESRFGADLEQ
jgi:hypothetical protein